MILNGIRKYCNEIMISNINNHFNKCIHEIFESAKNVKKKHKKKKIRIKYNQFIANLIVLPLCGTTEKCPRIIQVIDPSFVGKTV